MRGRRRSQAQLEAAKQYTIKEAAELAGVSEKAISGRLDRKTLKCVMVTRGGTRRRLVPHHALVEAGLIGTRVTKTDERLTRLVQHLRARPQQQFSTNELKWVTQRLGEPGLPLQEVRVALRTLRAAGLVSETIAPPRGRGGTPSSLWRWEM
jgi:hypothetical protein